MYESKTDWRRTGQPTNDFWSRFSAYIRSRRTEHWVMFAAGLIIGAILG